MASRRRRSNKRQRGFTLTELMIVVTIAGVLASLAIPQLQRYRYRARAWQAEEFLQAISLREEAYRSEFGRYKSSNPVGSCAALGDLSVGNPGCFNPNLDQVSGDDAIFASTQEWLEIGAKPAGQVYFGFGVVAGDPTTAPGAPINMVADFWWVARAMGDVDRDGTYALFELTSQSRRVWVDTSKGY